MLGLMLGVAVLILVLSVMNGFDRELRERILGMVPHANIMAYDGVKDWPALAKTLDSHPQVIASAPFIQLQGMLASRGVVQGVLLNGIDPELESGVSIVGDFMQECELDHLIAGKYGIVLGEILANRLGLILGDKVTLIMPEASLTPAGVLPRLKRFTLVGTFAVGADLDSNLALLHLIDAQKMARLTMPQGMRIKTTDLFAAPKISRELAMELKGNYYSTDWTRMYGNLFQAIKLEKTMIGLLLFIIVAVAAFNIISTLVMMVTDKQADIAILRTLGATPGVIMRIFMVQGLFIGVMGTIIGTIIGVLMALGVTDLVSGIESLLGIQLLNSDVYFISYLPSELKWDDVAIVCCGALGLSFLATLYPSYRASKINPAEALRYEL
jgi:lipoprotein-releasing system permease protein